MVRWKAKLEESSNHCDSLQCHSRRSRKAGQVLGQLLPPRSSYAATACQPRRLDHALQNEFDGERLISLVELTRWLLELSKNLFAALSQEPVRPGKAKSACSNTPGRNISKMDYLDSRNSCLYAGLADPWLS